MEHDFAGRSEDWAQLVVQSAAEMVEKWSPQHRDTSTLVASPWTSDVRCRHSAVVHDVEVDDSQENMPRAVAPRLRSPEEQAFRAVEWEKACDLFTNVRASIEAEFTDLSAANIDHFMATLVIGNNLGNDWVERHIEGGRRTDAANFLRSEPRDAFERHVHYQRTMDLARRIFELGQEDFAPRLFENLRRRDLEGAAFEAEVVRMLVSGPFLVDLREERGEKGDDYDIDLWLKPGDPWAIEVKTRADDAPFARQALKRTLDRARAQLPPAGRGTVFVKIPPLWQQDTGYLTQHKDVIEGVLRNSTRLQAVVLVWDKWTAGPKPDTFRWARDFETFRSADQSPELEYLLNFFEQIWRAPIDFGPVAPF